VQDMLKTPRFHIERRDMVLSAIRHKQSGKGAKAALVDTLIAQLAQAEGCTHTLSFDKGAARSAGLRLLV